MRPDGFGHRRRIRSLFPQLACDRLCHVDDGGAAQIAHVLGRLVRRGAVQGAAIVPDHQIADAPFVGVDEPRLGGEFDQPLQQRAAFLDRPADDVRGVRGDVERLAP